MSASRLFALSLVALFVLSAGGALADEPAAPGTGDTAGAATPPPKPPKTVAAQKGRFAVVLELTGAFEPRGSAEVSYEGEVWNQGLEVEEAVPLGPVQKDQILVRFKTDKIDKQVETTEADLRLAKTNLEKQVAEFQRQGEANEINLAQAKRGLDRAEENLKLFREVQLPLRQQQAEHGLKGTEYWIQDQVEELQQLEKMYGADDLTEETEEIVLRRTRRNLERMKKSFEFSKTSHRVAMEVELPRELENVEMAVRKERNGWDRLESTAKLALEAARLEVEKAKANFARQEENLAKLKADREGFVVKAPIAGVAVPGSFAKGKWAGLDETARALQPGKEVKPQQVLYTIVVPGNLGVRTTVGEADLLRLKRGQSGTATPTAAPDSTIGVTVARFSPVSTDGNHEVILDLDRADERLMPGNGVKVKLSVDEKADAVTVPAGAVYKDDGKTFVQVWADGEAAPREVKTGATSEGRTEIKEGLSGGEQVVEKPAKPEKSEKPEKAEKPEGEKK